MADNPLDPRKFQVYEWILTEFMRVGLTVFGIVLIAIDFHHLSDAATNEKWLAFALHLIIEAVYGGISFFSWKYWFKRKGSK